MSTNTDSADKPIKETPPVPKESGLSFLKEKWKIYLVIFLAIYFLGRVVSRGSGQELFTQNVRNIISAIGLFIVFLIGLGNAELVFLIFLLYIPFVDVLPVRFGVQYTALNLFNVLSTIVILCWFVDVVKKNRSLIIVNKTTKFASLFLFFSILSYIVNGFEYGTHYLGNQIFNMKRWIDPLLVFFITSGMSYRRDLRRDAIIAILLGTAMVIFLAVKDVGPITHFADARRIRGVGNQPNMLGAFVVDYMFLFLGILLVNFRKKIYWLASVPFWWGIRTVAVTFSRGAYMAFVVATLVISFLKSRILFVIVIAIFAYVATNLWVLPQAVSERIDMTVKGKEIYGYGVKFETSAGERIEAWKTTLSLIRNKPLLGYGIGMVGTYLSYYAGIGIGDVHNSFLLLAAECGLITLIIFLLCIFVGLRTSWFVYRHSKDEIIKGTALGFFAGICGLIVNCFFGSHMTTLWEIGYFWVLLSIFTIEEKELKNEASVLQQG